MSKEFDALVEILEECSCDTGGCHCDGECKCDEMLNRLFELLDHEISATDAKRLIAHGRQCPTCTERIEEEIILRKVVRRGCNGEAAPESLRMKITQIVTR